MFLTILNLIGWLVYIFIIYMAVTGILFLWRVAQSGSSVSIFTMSQWLVTYIFAIVFGLTNIPKAHLIWAFPICWVLTYTPMGHILGMLVGVITEALFNIYIAPVLNCIIASFVIFCAVYQLVSLSTALIIWFVATTALLIGVRTNKL